MKKFKKVMSLLLVAAMIALVGCSNSNDSAQAGTTDNAAGTETAGDASAAEEDAPAQAADGEVFKIGAIGPSTGSAAVYGLAVQNGADLAIKEINEAGGINGTLIEYNFQDDECDNEKSVNAYNTLKDWGMKMLVCI